MAKQKKGLVPSQIRETEKPSKQLKLSDLINMSGSSGTYIVHGFLEGDYNTDLSGQRGLEKYDEMRKSDAQVNAILDAMGLPIRSTEWFIEAGTNEDGETDDLCEEIRAFAEEALFRRMEQEWDDHLREVLTFLPFGFEVKEKVYTAADDKIWLKELAHRKQTTIYKWEQEDGTAGVTQILPTPIKGEDGKTKSWVGIPASKLLLFSFKREGDNYAGVSILRSAYRHWYTKDLLYKFDAIKHERQAVGVPYMKLPPKASQEDKELAMTILKDLRANEQTGIVLPEGWEFGFADLQAENTSDVWKSIEHHNQMIAKNVLAMFMEIVGGEQGSRALSEDQSDFFLLALEAVARQIDNVHNRFLMPELIDLNFDVPSPTYYPKLAHRKLGSVDYQTFSTVLSTLITAGVVTVDDPLEDFVRKLIDIPAKVVSEDDGMDPLDEGGEPEIDDDGNPIPPEDGMPTDDMDPLDMEDEEVDIDEEIDDELEASEFASPRPAPKYKRGDPLPEEVKKKISEALKKNGGGVADPRKDRIKKGTQRLVKQDSRLKNTLEYQRGAITKRSDQLKADLAKATSKAQKTALRKQAAAELKPLREMRAKDLATKKAVAALLKVRKTELKAKIKAIRDSLKSKKTDVEGALDPLRAQVTANRSQLEQLRARAKGLKGEAKEALRDAIAGLLDENKSIRAEAKSMRDEYGAARKDAKAKIDQEKADSGLYREGQQMPHVASEEAAGSMTAGEGESPATGEHGAHTGHDHGDAATQSVYQRYNEACDWKQIIALQLAVPRTFDDPEPRARPWAFNDIEKFSWRALTFAEKKVNFESLKKALGKAQGKFDADIGEITEKQTSDLLGQVKRAVEGNDIAAVGKIKAKYTGELAGALSGIQQDMFEMGKKSAAGEMVVKVPATAKEISGALRVQNEKLVDKYVTDLETAASNAVTQIAARKGGSISNTGTAEAVAAAQEAMEKAAKQGKAAMETLSVIGTLNLGRATIFERYPEEVVAMQYSAIIDDKTTNHCLSLDGKVVKPGSPEFYNYSPPQHYGCRSLWIEILRDEEFAPEITGIPRSIPAHATIDTFVDLKAPVIDPNSAAVTVLQDEIESRKAKVEEYKTAGLYANRIKQHEERIQQLNLAVAGNAKMALLPKTIKVEGVGEVKTPTGYLYHQTAPKNVSGIVESGLEPRVSRLDETKDGGDARVYLGTAEQITGQGVGMDSDGVMLRVPANIIGDAHVDPHIPLQGMSLYTKKGIDPRDIEKWDEQAKQWVPLVKEEISQAQLEALKDVYGDEDDIPLSKIDKQEAERVKEEGNPSEE